MASHAVEQTRGPRRLLLAATWRADVAILGAITGFVGAVYVFVNAPLYNPTHTVDTWLYTALFTNFHFTYHLFSDTYYASRLPWIIAGLFLHTAFPGRAAYFVLHTIFFLGGALSLFVIIRRFLGRMPAFIAFAGLITNQLYYTAETWDYVDGAVVTFLLAGFACSLTRAEGRRRVLALFGGGFFIAAAVATNIFMFALAVPSIALYAAVNYRRRRAREVAIDGAAFAMGAGLLLIACCLFAWQNGADWWFLGPQIRATAAINPASYRAGGYGWVVRVPRLIAPLLLLAAGAVVMRSAARGNSVERGRWWFGVGALSYLLVCESFVVGYEVAGAATLEYSFYESLLLPAMAISGAVAVYAATLLIRDASSRVLLVAAAIAAAAAPLLLIYWRNTTELLGSRGSEITVAVAFAAVALAVIASIRLRWRRLRAMAAGTAVALLVFGTNFAIAASPDVYNYAQSSPTNGDVYDVGMQLIRFLRTGGFQRGPLYFWFRERDGPEFAEVQSLYFFSYTYIGASMPRIDSDFRIRERLYRPRTLVLLCLSRGCHDAPRVLRRHGYHVNEAATTRLKSGRVAIWVRVLRLHR